MKRYLLNIGLVTLIGTSVINAQSNSTNTPQTFFQSVVQYFSAFNPNLTNTFATTKLVDLWTSVDSLQGNGSNQAKLADALGLSYTIPKSSFSIEDVLRTSGIAGVVVSDQLGVGFSITHVDTRLTIYGDLGYNLENGRPSSHFSNSIYGEIGLRVKKALTDNTYAGIGFGLDITGDGVSQVYQVLVGATF